MQNVSIVTLCEGCQSLNAASSEPMKNLPPGTSTMPSEHAPLRVALTAIAGGADEDGGATEPGAITAAGALGVSRDPEPQRMNAPIPPARAATDAATTAILPPLDRDGASAVLSISMAGLETDAAGRFVGSVVTLLRPVA